MGEVACLKIPGLVPIVAEIPNELFIDSEFMVHSMISALDGAQVHVCQESVASVLSLFGH